MVQEEIWKPIKSFEQLYEVSNTGKIRSCNKLVKCRNYKERLIKGRQLKQTKMRDGYNYVHLYKDTKASYKAVHRIVAEAFIDNKENKREVNHIDGNKTNNSTNNLEWVTPKENMQHAWKLGLAKPHYRKENR